jgi:transposase
MERRKFTREFKLEAVRLIKERGVSYVQASQDLGVHVSQLRDWVKKFADDPEHAFPGHGQMKPEQLEVARLKREERLLPIANGLLTSRMCGQRRVGCMWLLLSSGKPPGARNKTTFAAEALLEGFDAQSD